MKTEFLFSTGFQRMNLLKRARINGNDKVLTKVLKIAANCMDSTSFINLLMQKDFFESNALDIDAGGHPTAFHLVWEAAERN